MFEASKKASCSLGRNQGHFNFLKYFPLPTFQPLGIMNVLCDLKPKLKFDFRMFFVNLEQMSNNIKLQSDQLKKNKDVLVDREVDFVGMIMDNIKKALIKAYSLNIYVIEVAKFYREIMQRGLLQKIRGLNFEECHEKNCVENIQMFILAECKANQKLIRDKVRKDNCRKYCNRCSYIIYLQV